MCAEHIRGTTSVVHWEAGCGVRVLWEGGREGGGALGRREGGWGCTGKVGGRVGVRWEGGRQVGNLWWEGRVRVLFVLNVFCCDSVDSGCFSI